MVVASKPRGPESLSSMKTRRQLYRALNHFHFVYRVSPLLLAAQEEILARSRDHLECVQPRNSSPDGLMRVAINCCPATITKGMIKELRLIRQISACDQVSSERVARHLISSEYCPKRGDELKLWAFYNKPLIMDRKSRVISDSPGYHEAITSQ